MGDWLRMSRTMNLPVICDCKIPRGIEALRDKAVALAGPAATIADLTGGGFSSSALPTGLAEALAAQHQQQQEQLKETQPTQAASMFLPQTLPQSEPSSSLPIPMVADPSLSETEKAYQRAWLEHQMQAQMLLFETQQQIGFGLGASVDKTADSNIQP